jgi:hypothetical protein
MSAKVKGPELNGDCVVTDAVEGPTALTFDDFAAQFEAGEGHRFGPKNEGP